MKRLLLPLLLGMFCCISAHAEIRLGINAARGELVTLKNWLALSEYLSSQLGEHVRIVPLASAKFLTYAYSETDKPLHFALTNPVQTVMLRNSADYQPLLSLNGLHGPSYAGAIVVRQDSAIKRAEDLRGKKVIAMGQGSGGGHVFQVYHLLQRGIDVYKDLAVLSHARNQEQALLALAQGKFDAAFVRSGILESLDMPEVDKAQFRVLDEQTGDGLALRHSTALYPEYVLSAAPAADGPLRERLRKALVQLPPASAAARAAQIQGFIEVQALEEMEKILLVLSTKQDGLKFIAGKKAADGPRTMLQDTPPEAALKNTPSP